jgi:hypothetical protein
MADKKGGVATDTIMSPAEMKPLLMLSKREPVNAVVGMTRDKDGVILLSRRIKPKKLLAQLKADARKAKIELDITSLRFGKAEVDTDRDSGLVMFTVNKDAPGALRMKLLEIVKRVPLAKVEIDVDAKFEAEAEDDDEQPATSHDAPQADAAPLATPVDNAAPQAGDPDMPRTPADTQAPPAPWPGHDLVNDPDFEKLIEAMEADADEADKDWKSQVSDSVFDFLAPEQKTAYNQDGTQCEQARGDFNAEWNKIVFNRGGDPAKFLKAYDVFSLWIGALQRSNERVEALIQIGFDAKVGVFITFLRKWSQFCLVNRLTKRIEQLNKDLEAAEHAVTKAEIKTALNLVVSAVTLIVAPEAVLAKVALSAGGVAVHIAIDQTLGEGSATGTVVFVAGDSKEVIELSEHGEEALEKLKLGGKRLGVAGAAITGVLDVKDVYEGKEKVEKVAKEIEDLEKALDNVVNGSGDLVPQLAAFDKVLQALRIAVAQAIARGNDAAVNYDAIKAEITKVLHEAT